MKKTTRTLIYANILSLAAVLLINFLANSLPLNGNTTAELSDRYPNLFTPAGLTFAIWGVIYVWFIIWAGFQVAALFSKKIAAQVEPMLEKIGWLFAYSGLLNIGWLIAWHWGQLLVSVVIMANLLYILIQLNRAAGVGTSKSSNLEKWLEHFPLGIYQGWITVALIANVTAWLVSFGWSGGSIGEPVWTIVMIMVGGFLAMYMVLRWNNLGHGLAVAWALFGIYLKQSSLTAVGGGMVTWPAFSLVTILLLVVAFRSQKWLAY